MDLRLNRVDYIQVKQSRPRRVSAVFFSFSFINIRSKSSPPFYLSGWRDISENYEASSSTGKKGNPKGIVYEPYSNLN